MVNCSNVVACCVEWRHREAAGLVAPSEIVSLTRLPDPFAYTSSIYALYGNKRGLRQAGSLADALKVWEQN